MKLGYTIIYVADVIATVDFYERAFSLERRFVHESNMYAEMQTGETLLAFAAEPMAEMNGLAVRPNRKTDVAAGFEIAFVTADPRSRTDKGFPNQSKPDSSSLKEIASWLATN